MNDWVIVSDETAQQEMPVWKYLLRRSEWHSQQAERHQIAIDVIRDMIREQRAKAQADPSPG